jgi:rubrerythrin
MKKGMRSGPALQGLRLALMNEVDGREFYAMAAKNARLDATRQMFTFLAGEEELHYEAIREQIGRMSEGRPLRLVRAAKGRKAIRRFHAPLFGAEFATRAGKAEAEGEVAALSIGMTLEKRSIAQFVALRKKFERDEAAAKVFDGLIAWEKEHLDILTRHHEQLRTMFWEEARFWPF